MGPRSSARLPAWQHGPDRPGLRPWHGIEGVDMREERSFLFPACVASARITVSVMLRPMHTMQAPGGCQAGSTGKDTYFHWILFRRTRGFVATYAPL